MGLRTPEEKTSDNVKKDVKLIPSVETKRIFECSTMNVHHTCNDVCTEFGKLNA